MGFWMLFGMVTWMEAKKIRSSQVLVDYWHILEFYCMNARYWLTHHSFGQSI